MLDTAALENHIGQQILFDHLQKTFLKSGGEEDRKKENQKMGKRERGE